MQRAVLAAIVGLAVVAAGFVLRFGTNVPVKDEWDLVPDALTRVADGDWLEWPLLRHNEHYFPVGRAMFLATFAAGGWDLRSPMLLTVVLLTVAAGLFARAAAAARGRTSLGDVVLPALLLHLGHAYNLLMGYQVVFALLPLGVAGFVAGVMRDDGSAAIGRRLAAWAALIALCGGLGVVYVPGLASWLVYRGWVNRRVGGLAGAVGAAVALVGYAVWATSGMAPTTDPAEQVRGLDRLVVAGQFLEVGLGLWTLTGPWWTVMSVVVAGYLGVVALLLTVAVRRPDERVRALGLLVLGLGVVGMAAGVAWGRSGGLAERYVTPSVVGLCVAWVALARYGSNRVLPIVGVLAAILLLGLNVGPGWRFGMIQKMYHRDIEASARQGLPPTFLTARFGHLFGPPGWGVRQLTELRQARFGAFADLGIDQPYTDRPLANPSALSVPACDVASFIAHPPVVPVPPPGQHVVGLRLHYELDRDPTFVELVLSWNGGTARTTLWPRTGPGDTLFWVNADPSSITLRPLCPTFGIRVIAADWLVER